MHESPALTTCTPSLGGRVGVVLPLLLVLAVGCRREVEHEGRPIEYWISQMTSSDSLVRHRAIDAFAHDADRSPAAARALLAVLATERETHVHATIADALGLLGPDAVDAVPALIRLLDDEHEIVRVRAVSALGRIGPASPRVVPALARALRDRDHDTRATAAESLGAMGPAADAAVPGLLQMARGDRIGFARLQATIALGRIRSRAVDVLPALASARDSDWPMLREASYDAIGRYGREAAPMRDALRAGLRDSVPEVRLAATRALRATEAPSR